ncbi:SCO1664 family protein [Thalassiella azotivora]
MLDLLQRAELDVRGRLVTASNTTLYARLELEGVRAGCVYKPVLGERPLWDFPEGTLAAREVAAYQVSAAGGFDVVPPTVLRQDGPLGAGSVQLWVEPDDDSQAGPQDDPPDEADAGPADGREEVASGEPAAGLVDVVPPDAVPDAWAGVLDAYGPDGEPLVLAHALDARLATVAVLDVVANNADRKAGHLLTGPGGRVVGVDHGLTFHAEPKLRTVLWGFAGQPPATPDVVRLERLARALRAADGLEGLLTADEVDALRRRVDGLLRRRRMPAPPPGRPAIPWPPF